MEYRDWLVKTDHIAARDFDKLLLALASGGLAVSITFIHQIAPKPIAETLIWVRLGWGLLVISLLCALVSAALSKKSLRKAIQQVDDGSIRRETPGGGWATATERFSYASAALCILGISSLVRFAILNFGP